jgi:Transglutaminase-like superfamily
MKKLRKFLRLSSADRRLLIKSTLLLGAIKLGLWLLRFQTSRRLLSRVMVPTAELREVNQAAIDQVVWAVTVAGRYVPGATCLAQAMATQLLLSHRGHPTNLRIGVARSEQGQFQAHAWVECQGRVVIGGARAPSRFTPLPSLEGERP